MVTSTNVTLSRIGVASVIAHGMAQAAVGIIKDYTPEMYLQLSMIELRSYGFSGILIRKIVDEARNRHEDEIPVMESLLKGKKVKTQTNGGSAFPPSVVLMGPCMHLQRALGMEIGKIGEAAASNEEN